MTNTVTIEEPLLWILSDEEIEWRKSFPSYEKRQKERVSDSFDEDYETTREELCTGDSGGLDESTMIFNLVSILDTSFDAGYEHLDSIKNSVICAKERKEKLELEKKLPKEISQYRLEEHIIQVGETFLKFLNQGGLIFAPHLKDAYQNIARGYYELLD